jgi:hypothetical protein
VTGRNFTAAKYTYLLVPDISPQERPFSPTYGTRTPESSRKLITEAEKIYVSSVHRALNQVDAVSFPQTPHCAGKEVEDDAYAFLERLYSSSN